MQKDLSFYDDVKDVLNIRKRDRILIMGSMFFADLGNHVDECVFVKKKKEVTELIENGERFDKVLLFEDSYFPKHVILSATKLSRGLVCCFFEEEWLQESFNDLIETRFMNVNVWKWMTSVGPVCVTDAKGETIDG